MLYTKIAVVGGGLAGVALTAALVRRAVDSQQTNLAITIFEPGPIGPGVAYDTEAPDSFLLNHELDFMGSLNVHLDQTDAKDFYGWVQQNRAELSERYSNYDLANPKEYVPRNLFGKYIQARYRELVNYANANSIQVSEKRHRVDTIRKLTNKRTRRFGVEAAGTQGAFDKVVLATGNYFNQIDPALTHTGRYFQPYDYTAYMSDDIADGSVMLVAGTALAAYDAAIHALESGKYSQVIMASRRGMLRKVRGQVKPYERKYLTIDNLTAMAGGSEKPFRLKHLLQAVRAELAHAHGKKVSWKAGYSVKEILHILRRDIGVVEGGETLIWRSIHSSLSDDERHELYARLAESDKHRFVSEYSSLYQLISAPMPITNATKLHHYLETGKLVLVNGLQRVTVNDSGDGFDLHYAHQPDGTPLAFGRSSGAEATVHPTKADVCIDATGVGRYIGHLPLYRNLIDVGLAVEHPVGGIRVDMASREVVDELGGAIGDLYAVGHMACGETVLPHNSLQLSRACFVAVAHLMEGIKPTTPSLQLAASP